MSRNSIAGFMVGVGFGVVLGYFLKPPDETTAAEDAHARDVDRDTMQPAKPVSVNGRSSLEEGQAKKISADAVEHALPLGT